MGLLRNQNVRLQFGHPPSSSKDWKAKSSMYVELAEELAKAGFARMTPRGKNYLDLKPEQWNIIEELSQALEPFEGATVFLSGQEYITHSALPQPIQSPKKSIQTPAF